MKNMIKNTKRISLAFIILMALFLISGCQTEEKIEITLNPTSTTLFVGDELEIEVEVTGTETEVSWESGDNSIATVDNGMVTAIKPGNVRIKAFIDTNEAYCDISIEEKEEDELRLTLGLKSLVIWPGYSLEVKETLYLGSEKVDVDIEITTADNNLLEYKDGYLYAKEAGEVSVTATCVYEGKQISETVTIKIVEVEPKFEIIYASGEPATAILGFSEGDKISENIKIKIYEKDKVSVADLVFKGSGNVKELAQSMNAFYDLLIDGINRGEIAIAFYSEKDSILDLVSSTGTISTSPDYTYQMLVTNLVFDGTEYPTDSINKKVNVKREETVYNFSTMTPLQFLNEFESRGLARINISDKFTYMGDHVLELNTTGQWYPGINFVGLYNKRAELGIDSSKYLYFKMYIDYNDTSVTALHAWLNGFEYALFGHGELPTQEWFDVFIPFTELGLTSPNNFRIGFLSTSGSTIYGFNFSAYIADIRIVGQPALD